MRILYATITDLASKSGAVEHVLGISQGLADQGHEVHLVTGDSGDGEGYACSPHLSLHVVQTKGMSAIRAAMLVSRRAVAIAERIRPHVVYLRSFPADYVLLGRHLVRRGIPFVYELNTIIGAEYCAKKQPLRGWVYSFLEKKALAASSGWLPVTYEIAAYAKKAATVEKPWIVAYNGVSDVGRISAEERIKVRKSLGVSSSAPVLVMAGFSRPWHGLARALQMIALLCEEHEAFLWLVGSPNEAFSAKVKAMASGLGVQDRVRILPWVDRDEIVRYVSAADVGLGPLALDVKSMVEAQPLKVALYLSLGVPVLINYRDTRLDPGLPFVSYVPSTDPRQLVVGVRKLLPVSERLREQAREFVSKHLTWSAIARDTVKFIEQTLEGSN